MALTYLKIQNAKLMSRAYKLADSKALYLLVRPNGSKLWRMNYRRLDRQRTLHLGQWPDVSLSAAREKRDAARKQLAQGLDPQVERKLAELKAELSAKCTFKAVAEEWVQKVTREGRAQIEWLLGMAYPMIGSRLIAEISAQEVLLVLRKVEARGRYESARRSPPEFSITDRRIT